MATSTFTRYHVRSLSNNWETFREQLKPSAELTPLLGESPGLSVLSAIAGRQELWEMVLAATGYAAEKEPPATLTPSEVIQAYADDKAKLLYPDFEAYLEDVSRFDLGTLATAARVVTQALNLGPVTVNLLSCSAYCYLRYPNDPEKLRQCLEGCL